MTCSCGEAVTAQNLETLIDPVFAHFTKVHPEWEVGRIDVRNYLEAEDRMAGRPTERLDHIGEVEIVPIEPTHADEVIGFFDRDAFCDNPAWADCYCLAYFLNADAPSRPWQENREEMRTRISEGRVTGTLAYVDGRLAGWCNASARSEMPRRSGNDDSGVCSVVCFVVSPPHRRHGLSRLLLEGAIAEARRNGFDLVEAYPTRTPDTAASAFTGTLDLYLHAGFEQVTDGDRPTVQLPL
jgi:GNAT superfamily N-acetyltransferase